MRKWGIMKRVITCLLLTIPATTWAAKSESKPVEQPESIEWNIKECPNGVWAMSKLFTINPYDSKGHCFNYEGAVVQLLNRNTALFSKSMSDNTPFIYINFGKESVPMDNYYRSPLGSDVNCYFGVVKGKGAYNYKTVSGMQKIVFSGVPVQKSKAREAWENRIEDERRTRETEKSNELIAAAKAEQDWRDNNPTFIDQRTGLMWTRNGNIRGKTMTRDEALNWVKTLNFSGYNDWRLPNAVELVDFALLGGDSPVDWFNANGFYNVQPNSYWTSDFMSMNGVSVNFAKSPSGSKTGWGASGVNNYLLAWPVRAAR
jgi:hypothetical protein